MKALLLAAALLAHGTRLQASSSLALASGGDLTLTASR